jgi:hypothetical protein
MKNSKVENEFYLEPDNFDNLSDLMSSVLLYECINSKNCEYFIKPLKSKFTENVEYLIEIKLFNINFK